MKKNNPEKGIKEGERQIINTDTSIEETQNLEQRSET
jgi:hypothetical protein